MHYPDGPCTLARIQLANDSPDPEDVRGPASGIRDSVANATDTGFSLPYGPMATPEPKEMTGRAAVRPGGTLGYREMRISVLSVSRVSFVP